MKSFFRDALIDAKLALREAHCHELAYELGLSFGFSSVDFRNNASNRTGSPRNDHKRASDHLRSRLV
ncbi:MAG TPA: hypothetical protein DCP63_05240 [Bacteroidetes bacterium]|nr:hypothetical protein [Bacteroidota bacterium]